MYVSASHLSPGLPIHVLEPANSEAGRLLRRFRVLILELLHGFLSDPLGCTEGENGREILEYPRTDFRPCPGEQQGGGLQLRIQHLLVLVLFSGAVQPGAEAQSQQSKSTLTIHVAKSGLFSAFAHNHTVLAPVARVAVDEKSKTASITVLTAEMKVTDPEVSEKDRAEIQATMMGPKVLDAQKFPEIRFTSSRIEETAPRHFRVSGALQLHGVTKELAFTVTGTPEHYSGTTKLKQTDFGIQPVAVAGGTVKVKDEIQIDFDVYPATQSQALRR